MLNVAKKFANDALRASSRVGKSNDLLSGLVNGAKRNFSNDDYNQGHDPRFLIIVDEEMKAQKEEISKNPSMLKSLQTDPSQLGVNVVALQKNVINRLKGENADWTKSYIEQLTKEMEETIKTPDKQGRGR